MHGSAGTTVHFAPRGTPFRRTLWPDSTPVLSAAALAGVPGFIHAIFGEKALRRIAGTTLLDLDLIADPDAFMPHALLADFTDAVERQTGERDFGAMIAPHLSVRDYGVYGRYILGSPTLSGAVKRAIEAARFHSSTDGLTFTRSGDVAHISYRSAARGLEGYSHIASGSVGVILSICRSYLSPSWRPLRVELDVPRPPSPRVFEEAFGCPVRFDASAPAVCLDVQALAARRTPPSLARAVTLQDVAAARIELASPSLPAVVMEQIRIQLMAGPVSLERTAEALDMSTRTLQRELNRSGMTFRALTNLLRLLRAKSLLAGTTASVTEIAFDLGYSSQQHFARAFRTATGRSPREFRSARAGRASVKVHGEDAERDR